MQILLFRHAEKEFYSSGEVPLSARGMRQAENILAKIQANELPKPTGLITSPKLRSKQTLNPTAFFLKLNLFVNQDLDERKSTENSEEFRKRVQKFVAWTGSQAEGTYFLCTHLDWIEEALSVIPVDVDLLHGLYSPWSPADFMHFEIRDRVWCLINKGAIEL